MNDLFYKPYLNENTARFPYSREVLLKKPIFPALVLDCGAYLCANDILGTANADVMLERIMDGSLFDYWRDDGKFEWCAVSKRYQQIPYTSEYEAEIFLNRLYILQPLAQAYAKTRDMKYANAWFAILDHWRQNNIYRGPDPTSLIWKDMQMSWRLVAMIYGIYLMGTDDTLTKEQWYVVYDMIRQHAAIMLPELAEDIEQGNMSNHVTLKAVALTLAGVLLPELCDAAATIETVREYISIQLKNKYYPDGTSREMGHTYRFFTTRLYVELELTLTKNGYAPIEGCNERMQRSYEFLYQFSAPNGMSPQIGDSYALDVHAEIDYVNSFYPLTFSRQKKSVLFADGKMAVLRNGKFTLLVEAMPVRSYPAGQNTYSHHQHAGRMQYLLYAGDQPLVLDSGCPNYDRALIYTPLAKEAGHNVIRCDEVLIQEPDNLICTGTEEDPVILNYVENKKVSARNTLTAPDGRSYTWTRTFEMDEDSLTVTDEVKGNGVYHYESYLHLPPAITGYCNWVPQETQNEPLRKDNRQLRLRFGRKFLYVETDSPVESSIQPYYNEENKPDYCQVLTRRFCGDFCERTVFRFE